VSDILSQGKDRDPRGSRWRLIAVGIGIAAVAAVLIVLHLPGQRPVTGRPANPATAVNPAPSGTPGSIPPASRMPPDRPAMMAGRPLPRGTTLWLPLGGHRPAWLSVATGRTEPIRGLPKRGNGYQLIRIAGGWAAQPFPADNASCATCDSRLPVYYFADGSRAASRVGTADFIAPAATAGALWLVSYRPGADTSVAAGSAQEVSITGSALGPRLRLPAGYVIDKATRAGLLLVPEVPGPGAVRYELWDPGTRRVMRSFENVIAASPAEIAWMPGCTEGCRRVHVLDLPGGQAGEISLPGRSQAFEGAFSPDGRFLALLVTARIGAGGRAAATRLVVAVVASGRLMAVPGTTVGSGRGFAFGWQAGSGRLVADVSLQHGWQIAVWRPGEARLSVALARAPSGSWPVADEGPY